MNIPFLRNIFRRRPTSDEAERASTLLGINPNRPLRKGQIIPQELMARLHQLNLITGSNTHMGYELEDIRKSWDEYLFWFDSSLRILSNDYNGYKKWKEEV